MTERPLSEVLQDILDAIADIEMFTAEVDFEAFRHNREKVLAVVKAIKILGEAVKKIPEDIRRRYPQIPWECRICWRRRNRGVIGASLDYCLNRCLVASRRT